MTATRTREPKVGEVRRVAGERGGVFRIHEIDVERGEVSCYGGTSTSSGDRLAFRTFRIERLGSALRRTSWPLWALPPEERAEAARRRASK